MEIFDPTRMYMNSKEGSGEVCKVQSVVVLATVGVDKLILAAVTGKIIRIMGWRIYSTSTTGATVTFKNGATANFLASTMIEGNNAREPNDVLPIVHSGYAETSVGLGLYADVTTTDVYVTVFYITYTP